VDKRSTSTNSTNRKFKLFLNPS